MPIVCVIYTFLSAFRPFPILKQSLHHKQAQVYTGSRKVNVTLIVYNPE